MGCTRVMSATWPTGTCVSGSGSRVVVLLTLAMYSGQEEASSEADVTCSCKLCHVEAGRLVGQCPAAASR